MDEILLKRKEKIEAFLSEYRIKMPEITSAEFLDFKVSEMRPPAEVFIRSVILFYLVLSKSDEVIKKAVRKWFKHDDIFKFLTIIERKWLYESSFLKSFILSKKSEPNPNFEHNLESAYILLWCLDVVKAKPQYQSQIDNIDIETVWRTIPKMGESVTKLSLLVNYRNTEEIYLENVYYELTTAYFRDCFIFGNEPDTILNPSLILLRHKALNWVRQFGCNQDWDSIDTST